MTPMEVMNELGEKMSWSLVLLIKDSRKVAFILGASYFVLDKYCTVTIALTSFSIESMHKTNNHLIDKQLVRVIATCFRRLQNSNYWMTNSTSYSSSVRLLLSFFPLNPPLSGILHIGLRVTDIALKFTSVNVLAGRFLVNKGVGAASVEVLGVRKRRYVYKISDVNTVRRCRDIPPRSWSG